MRREVFAFTAGPLMLAILLFAPAVVFFGLIVIFVTGAMVELSLMARHSGIPAPMIAPAAAVAAVVVVGLWRGPTEVLVALTATAFIFPLLQLAHPDRPERALEGVGVAVFGVIYLGIGALSLCAIHRGADGRLVLWSLIIIWVGDAGAYYVGSRFGKHKMAPRISPKKSWEGLVGGFVISLLAAFIAREILVDWLPLSHALAGAVTIGFFAPLGDLVESAFKRSTGVKDSSSLIPGHGGLFDRCDSIVLAAPPLFGLFWLLGTFGG